MSSQKAKRHLSKYVGWVCGQPLNERGVIRIREFYAHSPSEAVMGAMTRAIKDAYDAGRRSKETA